MNLDLLNYEFYLRLSVSNNRHPRLLFVSTLRTHAQSRHNYYTMSLKIVIVNSFNSENSLLR